MNAPFELQIARAGGDAREIVLVALRAVVAAVGSARGHRHEERGEEEAGEADHHDDALRRTMCAFTYIGFPTK